ncbi:hemerythrin domain-containing protein [Rufibacter sediminis]|uniref:Hemerythrin-like domain-containing protein n=1 Tax=Rufibacter sediminis TaxID=2762756 RepID=A0ABR6VPB5_9BACT|nr:hypothetical protein [Rufibacter sediminis]MBC3539028.1 hypothetical protein [Rufibacter sediminis]
MEQGTTPLKRDKNLVPLSREHHFGLLFCWKLRQGLKNKTDLNAMQGYVKYFWNQILFPHCQEEEWLLQRFLVPNDILRVRIEEEHRHLHWVVDSICDGKRLVPEQFQTLEQYLVSHIRWEERELFPYLQKVVPQEDLEEAGKLMEQHHQTETKVDNFTPEFWKE